MSHNVKLLQSFLIGEIFIRCIRYTVGKTADRPKTKYASYFAAPLM